MLSPWFLAFEYSSTTCIHKTPVSCDWRTHHVCAHRSYCACELKLRRQAGRQPRWVLRRLLTTFSAATADSSRDWNCGGIELRPAAGLGKFLGSNDQLVMLSSNLGDTIPDTSIDYNGHRRLGVGFGSWVHYIYNFSRNIHSCYLIQSMPFSSWICLGLSAVQHASSLINKLSQASYRLNLNSACVQPNSLAC